MSWVQGIWVRSGRFVGTGCRRPRRAGADNGGPRCGNAGADIFEGYCCVCRGARRC